LFLNISEGKRTGLGLNHEGHPSGHQTRKTAMTTHTASWGGVEIKKKQNKKKTETVGVTMEKGMGSSEV